MSNVVLMKRSPPATSNTPVEEMTKRPAAPEQCWTLSAPACTSSVSSSWNVPASLTQIVPSIHVESTVGTKLNALRFRLPAVDFTNAAVTVVVFVPPRVPLRASRVGIVRLRPPLSVPPRRMTVSSVVAGPVPLTVSAPPGRSAIPGSTVAPSGTVTLPPTTRSVPGPSMIPAAVIVVLGENVAAAPMENSPVCVSSEAPL